MCVAHQWQHILREGDPFFPPTPTDPVTPGEGIYSSKHHMNVYGPYTQSHRKNNLNILNVQNAKGLGVGGGRKYKQVAMILHSRAAPPLHLVPRQQGPNSLRTESQIEALGAATF